MSAGPSDDRRVAEMWEKCAEIATRMANGVYIEEIVVSPSNKVEEALAYGLQRIGEEASRLSFDAKTIAKLPWDGIAGLRDILSHDYPGISSTIRSTSMSSSSRKTLPKRSTTVRRIGSLTR
jgi:uncharacterized protein with HEPN domain